MTKPSDPCPLLKAVPFSQWSAMKQVAMDGVAPFLPQEIITNILKLLPMKSLIRFQCVCKQWKNLIKTPSFIAAHLHHSAQNRPCLLFHRYVGRNRLQLHLLDCEMQIVDVQNKPVVDGLAWVVGSSNGLLCLRIDRNVNRITSPPSLLLWNPAFREVRQVSTTFPEFYRDCYLGFGFSPIVNDYRIVMLHVSKYDNQVHLVETYSLGTGSWKKIEAGNLGGLTNMNTEGFAMNGAVFWLGRKQDMGEGSERFIVSFDIATEVFELIPMPPVTLTFGVYVTEFENRLALLYSHRVADSVSCLIEVWVLEEGTGGSGEGWSWAKKYTGISPCLFRAMAIWRNEFAGTCHLMPGDKGPEFIERTVMSNFTRTELKVLFDKGHEFSIMWKALYQLATYTLKSLNLHVNDALQLYFENFW